MLEAALVNPSLVMLVVEPNPENATIERVRRYKGSRQARLRTDGDGCCPQGDPFKFATFDDFARSIMPDVQWLDDFLRLRRFEKQIQASDRPSAEDAGAGSAE